MDSEPSSGTQVTDSAAGHLPPLVFSQSTQPDGGPEADTFATGAQEQRQQHDDPS
jgi:hypothetical protein